MSLELTCKIDRILGTIGYHLLKRSVPERSKVRPETVKVIAVVKFLGGGSLTLAAPALLALKKRYPDAEFLLLTTPAVRANAELLGIYDRIFLFSPRKPFSAFKTLFPPSGNKKVSCSTCNVLRASVMRLWISSLLSGFWGSLESGNRGRE